MALAIARPRQRSATSAVVAIICALGSFLATFTGHPGGGAAAAVIAVLSGVMGMAMAASPRLTGGKMSIAAIILGIFGLGVAVLGMLGKIVF